MAHDPTLAYADYFAAAGGGVATATLLGPDQVDDAEEGHHQLQYGHGLDVFGAVRGLGLMPGDAAAAHGNKAALADFAGVLAEQQQEHHHHQHHRHAPPLTSLSLHGGHADAATLALHQHQHHQAPAAWPQQHPQAQQQGAWHLMRGSRFLRPAQQLLQEFCSLPVEAETATTTGGAAASNSRPPPAKPASEDGDSVGGGGGGSSSSAPLSAQIQAMDAAELQRLKAKLYAMLQEVERRYRRYREQMRAVAGSFEAVAGERAAAAYTRLASRTISKHFRNLRDGVAAQVQAVRRALGEKDADGAPATAVAKGETTPRLRVLDQCLRQHRAYQAGVLESQPWRPQRGLPERAVSVLRAWLFEHFLHPYPSDVDKHILARQTGLSRSQVSNWFINARVRLWKPMVEEMYAEEMKDDHPQEADQAGAAAACSNATNKQSGNNNNNPSGGFCAASELGQPPRVSQQHGGGVDYCGGVQVERKPTRAQLVVHDPGSLASVVSIGSGGRGQQGSINFGMMDHLDFGAYSDDPAGPAGSGFGGGGVSLTLGLQPQHADDPHGGVNVAFAAAPSAAHEFLFTAGGEQQVVAGGGGVHTHHGHHGQFGGADLDGDGMAAASHYHRGLSAATTGGFQFLHDMAGWSH